MKWKRQRILIKENEIFYFYERSIFLKCRGEGKCVIVRKIKNNLK